MTDQRLFTGTGTARRSAIEECARELETSYPDHAWLNAACAAIRSLSSSDGRTETVRDTCVDCGKIDPCDDDCPNFIEPTQSWQRGVEPRGRPPGFPSPQRRAPGLNRADPERRLNVYQAAREYAKSQISAMTSTNHQDAAK